VDIPGAEPFGQSFETARLIVGIGVLVLAVIGAVLYMRWKLPCAGRPSDGHRKRGQSADGERDIGRRG
jgi:uncharacterized protein YpmB